MKNKSRTKHGQQRANNWKQNTLSTALPRKYSRLRQGWKQFKRKLIPTHEELCSTTMHRHTNTNNHQGLGLYVAPNNTTTQAPSATSPDRDLYLMTEYLRDGGQGFMPESKEQGWIRIGFENWNSLGLFTQRWKLDRLNAYIRQLSIDVIAGCEVQTDWSFLPKDQRFVDIICPEQTVKGVHAHNRNERIQREQVGGTAIAAVGKVSEMVETVGADDTGLGRWSWICLGDGNTRTYIVSAYFPHAASRGSKGFTAHDQQRRYFESKGNFTSPQKLFVTDLLALIRPWRLRAHKVILAIDANQDVYTGDLSRRLAQEPYQLTCMFLPTTGCKVPPSHFRGKTPITTIFGSPGLTTGHAMCYPHWFGIGDHRLFIIEVTAESVYGGRLPRVVRPASRQLNCRIPRIRQLYTKHLQRLCTEHRMQDKLDDLILKATRLSNTELVHLEHDAWDLQFGQLMASAENACTKFKTCILEHSPTIGLHLRRRQVLHWLLRYHDGKVCNKGNLGRACKANGIAHPFSTTTVQVEALLQETIETLHQLAPQAEALRREHLKHRLQVAKDGGHDETTREILRIIRREGQRKRQRMINHIVRPRQGRAVTEVSEVTATGTTVHVTESSILSAVGKRLSERFRLGLRAPSTTDQEIASVVGLMSDNDTAKEILAGTYEFPSTWDTPTVLLMKEAAKIKSELDAFPTCNDPITTSDFTSYWRTAKEDTSSSYSGRHFGHYKAASTEDSLSLLHTTSLNLAAQRGEPITRWKHGVTVLLEKVPGNNSIDRLRAICLLEADFNWWLKMIFTRRMMKRMHDHKAIPAEQIATSGKTSIDGVMMKQLFYDRANVLHNSASLSSTDAANCYDAVNHPICSMALQAFGISLSFIKNYLSSLQTMQFHLRTGFGLSDDGFGGTAERPFMGLTQGSGASPPVWTAVSTLIVNAYKNQGHGPQFASLWSNLIFILAAILFVDDTDLLHMCQDPHGTDAEFIAVIQRATRLWTLLLQATGGNLKPQKCYWYFLSYTFDKGQPRLKKLREIIHHEIRIPQLGGADVPISLLDVSTASKTLGVYTCPSGDCASQLEAMGKKGTTWAHKVGNSSLSPGLAWHSFHLQLIPSIRYGLVPVMAYPHRLSHTFDKVYFNILPALGVNRHIRKEWRTLPVAYQGLGMPYLALEKVALSLQFIQRHWKTSSTIGLQLLQAYELLQMETGLEGHVLQRDFSTYGCLASHSWFKILWSYLDRFQIELDLGPEYLRQPPRERDRHFMEVIIQACPRDDWIAINRVRKFKQVYYLSHVLRADGTTVDRAMLNHTPGPHRGRIAFPREEPTPSDFILWQAALQLVTSSTFRYSPPLGVFITEPMERDLWIAPHGNTTTIYHRHANDDGAASWYKYVRVTKGMGTRGSTRFQYESETTDPTALAPNLVDVLSVDEGSFEVVTVHSRVIWDRSPLPHTATTLHDYVLTSGARSLWKNLKYDGDGLWMRTALEHGTLLIVHDGSYMPHLSADLCSAGGVITCTRSKLKATFSWCERTSATVADNYRGELLGGMISLLLLQAVCSIRGQDITSPVPIYCDNSGVVAHGQDYRRNLPEKQIHSDLLRVIRRTIANLPCQLQYQHLYGHQDDNIPFDDLPLPAQMNVIADSLAKESLLSGHTSSTPCMSSAYPGEVATIRLVRTNARITSSIREALYIDWGYHECRQLMLDRGYLRNGKTFDAIHWDSVRAAMSKLPRMYQVWVAKHVSHFCGTNLQLWRMQHEGTTSPLCPCCHRHDETISHITCCPEEGRTELFLSMVDSLEDWLIDTYMDTEVATGIGAYLRSRGSLMMRDILADNEAFIVFARTHDALGWNNFLEGRISSALVDIQRRNFARLGRLNTLKKWCVTLIHKLLDLTHRQWLYRNLRLHLVKYDNMSLLQHEEIMQRVEREMQTDPSTLLPQYRYLLEADFHELGAASSHTRQVWLAEVHTAQQATSSLRRKRHSGLEITHRPNLAKRARN